MNDQISQVKDLIQKGKMTGSWLISGAYGVGKKAFATQIASALLTGSWDKPLDFHADLKWVERSLSDEAKKEISKTILAGKTVNVDEKQPRKKNISVDDIREALQFLSLKSTGNNPRVLIVNLADDMNENAANALLKMLEEPYPNTVILLLCENMGRILPTIRSRCRKLFVKPLSFEMLCSKIKQEIPNAQDIDLVADLSEGSFGLAKDIYENQGVELYQDIFSFCVPVRQINWDKLASFAQTLAKDEKKYFLFRLLLNHLISETVKKNALQGISPERVLDVYNEINLLFAQTETINLDKKQSVMDAIIQLSEAIND